MGTSGRQTFLQLVAVLLVTGGLRAAWHARVSGGDGLPGRPVEVEALADSAARLAEAEARRSRPLAPGERLDPNRASAEELDRLPGVGPATAQALVAARDTLPFRSLEDLARARGIGERTVAGLAEHLALESVPVRAGGRRTPAEGRPRSASTTPSGGTRVAPSRGSTSSPSPSSGGDRIPVNRATASELEALPGVGPVLAARIVEHRTRHGPFRTVEDLQAVPGIGPALLERLRPAVRIR